MKKETTFGTVEYGGEYAANPFSPIDTADTAPSNICTDTPYLAHSLTRTARLWSWLHPAATHAERVELLQIVAREMGVAECIKCPV